MNRRIINRWVCLFLVSACLSGNGACASTAKKPATPPYDIRIVNDVSYGAEEVSPRHRLDIYYPVSVDHPVVLFYVHGGAWRSGDKAMFANLGKLFAMHYGYTVVIPNFRLSNPNDGNAVHPDHINDVSAAFAWIRKNITFHGGDPGRIFVFGHSSGAHMVSLLASDSTYLRAQGCRPADIRGVIGFSGIYALSDMVRISPLQSESSDKTTSIYGRLIQDVFGGLDKTVLEGASPRSHLSAGQPPFLVVYADQDLPGMNMDAIHYHAAASVFPTSEVRLEHLVRTDFSEATWSAAASFARERTLFGNYVGHFAEILAITRMEVDSRPVRLVVEFIRDHS